MKFIYNVIFSALLLLASPFYFAKMRRRGNWREGFGQRFGKYGAKLKMALTNRHTIWIHAVSVGEVNIATQLIRALEARAPNLTIVVSTTTSTGMGELKKKLPFHIQKIYYPIDRKKFVLRAFRLLRPEAIVLVEAEIWPNFLWTARSQNVPVFLVNARMSPKSHRGYKRFGFLFRPLFASLRGVGVQNEEDQQRLTALGCVPEAVRVVGNLKFDGAASIPERRHLDPRALLAQCGVGEGRPVIVAGSTHPGEEAILARVFVRLRQFFPTLFLVVVPRHFERGHDAAEEIRSSGVEKLMFRSELSSTSSIPEGELDCLLVNTTGELRFFYEVATAIFVGKSLRGEGGQNPIEPAALGKPVVFGPNMENFSGIVAAMLAAGGAAQVKDEDSLFETLRLLLGDAARREAMGRAGVRVVRENQGSIDRTVEMILPHLKDEDIFIRPRTAPSSETAISLKTPRQK